MERPQLPRRRLPARWVLGLCFGIQGYGDPVSNRESGYGRPDIQLRPEKTPFFDSERPLLTLELKFARDAGAGVLQGLASEGLEQICEQGYDAGPLPTGAYGRVRWGIVVSGKRMAVACERT